MFIKTNFDYIYKYNPVRNYPIRFDHITTYENFKDNDHFAIKFMLTNGCSTEWFFNSEDERDYALERIDEMVNNSKDIITI